MSGGRGDLHMRTPIWVWCYLTSEAKHQSRRAEMPPLAVGPDVHTYAFTTEAEALAHPEKMGWSKVHGFSLRKAYLQSEPTP